MAHFVTSFCSHFRPKIACKIGQEGRIDMKLCVQFYSRPFEGPENFNSFGPASFAAHSQISRKMAY